MRLVPGDHAPDAALYSPDGGQVPAADLWREQPVIVAFMRHFG